MLFMMKTERFPLWFLNSSNENGKKVFGIVSCSDFICLRSVSFDAAVLFVSKCISKFESFAITSNRGGICSAGSRGMKLWKV